MDTHGMGSNNSMEMRAQKLSRTLGYFEQQAGAMERKEKLLQSEYERKTTELEKLINKSNTTTAHRLLTLKKHADREYRKRILQDKQETKVMKDIVTALRRGDSKALNMAQGVLQKQLEAAQAKVRNFLYFLQLGHRLVSRDCTFCVAQCIGKCREGGALYAQCMPECASAGH